MGLLRHEYCSGLPFPSPGDLPNLGIKPASPVTPALAGRFFTTEPPWRLKCYVGYCSCWRAKDLFPQALLMGISPKYLQEREGVFWYKVNELSQHTIKMQSHSLSRPSYEVGQLPVSHLILLLKEIRPWDGTPSGYLNRTSMNAYGEGNVNPLQYSCLENSVDRGAWQATVHGVANSRTWLSNTHTQSHTHTHNHTHIHTSVLKDAFFKI